MGFARLRAGRTSIVVDAAPPPAGPGSGRAHASTLALELTSGRRAVIVSCGPGAAFGPVWRRARAGHVLALHAGRSGAARPRAAAPDGGPDAPLLEVPREVRRERYAGPDGPSLKISHDGWRETHGLTHARELDLAPDGRTLRGEDTLAALTEEDARRFEAALTRLPPSGLAWCLRFHLHPGRRGAGVARRRLGARGAGVGVRCGSWSTTGPRTCASTRRSTLEPTRPRPVSSEQIVAGDAGRASREPRALEPDAARRRAGRHPRSRPGLRRGERGSRLNPAGRPARAGAALGGRGATGLRGAAGGALGSARGCGSASPSRLGATPPSRPAAGWRRIVPPERGGNPCPTS